MRRTSLYLFIIFFSSARQRESIGPGETCVINSDLILPFKIIALVLYLIEGAISTPMMNKLLLKFSNWHQSNCSTLSDFFPCLPLSSSV